MLSSSNETIINVHLRQFGTIKFIREVLAIIVTVTHPRLLNAQTVLALKLIVRTIHMGSTPGLIRIITTIIVTVAQPIFRNARKRSWTHYVTAICLTLGPNTLDNFLIAGTALLLVLAIVTVHVTVATGVHRSAHTTARTQKLGRSQTGQMAFVGADFGR